MQKMVVRFSSEATDEVVNRLVATGRFSSPNDVISQGVRLLDERETRLAELDRLVEEGDEDAAAGRIIDADTLFSELRNRYRTF
jgi:antitoxin ParD1/3/4